MTPPSPESVSYSPPGLSPPKLSSLTLPRVAQVHCNRPALPLHRPKRAISALESPAITAATPSQLPFAPPEALAPLCTCSHRARLLSDSAWKSIQSTLSASCLPPVDAAGWSSEKREGRCRAEGSQDARRQFFILQRPSFSPRRRFG
jgi:hypothetical protein